MPYEATRIAFAEAEAANAMLREACPPKPDPRITAEDWENACHALIWTKDPAAFDAIRAEAERERTIRLAR